jgi:hypothetical protein
MLNHLHKHFQHPGLHHVLRSRRAPGLYLAWQAHESIRDARGATCVFGVRPRIARSTQPAATSSNR